MSCQSWDKVYYSQVYLDIIMLHRVQRKRLGLTLCASSNCDVLARKSWSLALKNVVCYSTSVI